MFKIYSKHFKLILVSQAVGQKTVGLGQTTTAETNKETHSVPRLWVVLL